MTSPNNSESICLYCAEPIFGESKDHIFPQFLGGKRMVNSCKKCNNTFGHTFEGKAAKSFQALHVQIISWGVPLLNRDVLWNAGHIHNGRTYNFGIGEKGVMPILSKPFIEYDSEGAIKTGQFAERKHAERFGENLIRKGKATEVKIAFVPTSEIDFTKVEHVLELGSDIRRLALKMTTSLASVIPNFSIDEIAEARSYLTGEKSQSQAIDITVPAYDMYDIIDSRRKALSHVIYVERGDQYVYGFVQFFGVIQLYCHLGSRMDSRANAAMFASLDPITGEEELFSINPINLKEPPRLIRADHYPSLINGWLKKFRTEAIGRDATFPPDLRINSIEIKKPE